jgi:hypothetical protein
MDGSGVVILNDTVSEMREVEERRRRVWED